MTNRITKDVTDPGDRKPVRPRERPGQSADSIAISLKKMFDTVADEPVPDEFMALLDRIAAKERDRGDGEKQ